MVVKSAHPVFVIIIIEIKYRNDNYTMNTNHHTLKFGTAHIFLSRVTLLVANGPLQIQARQPQDQRQQ